MKSKFQTLAYNHVDDFIYGKAPHPVTLKNGLVIGGGEIIPELNFTLPPMQITQSTLPEVIKQYTEIIEDACKRADELYLKNLVAEIELLPPTTYEPSWGIEITKVVKDVMMNYEINHGIKTGLRITPVDIREDRNSPHMWRGEYFEKIMDTFRGCALAGANMLSIESIGGKDVHDDAIMFCDIKKSLFGLGILGVKDMEKLWTSISDIASETDTISAGDTACGFANTAMVLADRKYIPKVFAAIVRVMASVRSLVAYEVGAVGPHKDCGYEGVYVKAITGTPISLEGKSSACAHLSPVGNIAAAVADLWSNESIQNIKLLGGMAPTISMEQLIYDCRLMNVASSKGHDKAIMLRDWLVESDSLFDPQAYVLRPDIVFSISKVIVEQPTYFLKIKAAALACIDALRYGLAAKSLLIDDKEIFWLDHFESELLSISDDEEAFLQEMLISCASEKFEAHKYDL